MRLPQAKKARSAGIILPTVVSENSSNSRLSRWVASVTSPSDEAAPLKRCSRAFRSDLGLADLPLSTSCFDLLLLLLGEADARPRQGRPGP